MGRVGQVQKRKRQESWGWILQQERAPCSDLSQVSGWKSISLRVWQVPINKWIRSRSLACVTWLQAYIVFTAELKFLAKNIGE